jgi:phosphatidylserine/phosphatidylglycerophosphate/cardiolipin synthase-like enzyme
MRTTATSAGLTVRAIAGSHVVVLGFNMAEDMAVGLLGFAVGRRRGDGPLSWMRGQKTFAATDSGHEPGRQVTSIDHPFQTFQWSDYSVEPDTAYTYTIIAMRGAPTALVQAETVTLTVKTEDDTSGRHSVYFNRGAVASQEYARRFHNKLPSDVGPPAYAWLSRGLVEGLLDFIDQAKDPSFALHGAFYEFKNSTVLDRLKASRADVAIIYDAKYDDALDRLGQGEKTNRDAIARAGLQSVVTPRTHAKIAHNKFLVLSKDGAPLAVWTGSTNLTENGIYGHSNLGHIVRDGPVAAAYLAYWHTLKGDPDHHGLVTWTETQTPAPPHPWTSETTAIFSPRGDLTALDWYAALAGSAKHVLMMTFAFGMHPKFVSVYDRDDSILRFALMEKTGLSDVARREVDRVRRRPNVVVAVGAQLPANPLDTWLRERTDIVNDAHVHFIHTKYMLIDPLGDDPIIVTGSANFSAASTTDNDENTLVIRGNQGVADIYLGEFMRLHSHYAFRESQSFATPPGDPSPDPTRHLVPSDAWIKAGGYFKLGSARSLRRTMFAGP